MSLICNEIMLPPSCSLTDNCDSPFVSNDNDDVLSPTPFINSLTGDFSSDDSVKDKNYCPSDSLSDDKARKDGVVNALKNITGPHKMRFWHSSG